MNVAPSYAVNLIGNLPQSNDNRGTDLSSSTGPNVKTVSFTLPTGTAYTLDDAVLRLEGYADDAFRVQIRDHNAGTNRPGSTALVNFNLPVSQGIGTFDYVFTPQETFAFQPNTTYWLYVDISSGAGGTGAIRWTASATGGTPNGITPTGVATFGQYLFSNNGGAGFTATPNTLNSFQINATPVPFESDALPIVGSTLILGLGLWGKNKLAQRKINNLK
jgi:hypothetical protein